MPRYGRSHWPFTALSAAVLAGGAILGVGGALLGWTTQVVCASSINLVKQVYMGVVAGLGAGVLWCLGVVPRPRGGRTPPKKDDAWFVFWGTFWGLLAWPLATMGFLAWAGHAEAIRLGTADSLLWAFGLAGAVGLLTGTVGGILAMAAANLTRWLAREIPPASTPRRTSLRPRRWYPLIAAGISIALVVAGVCIVPTHTLHRAILDDDLWQVRMHLFWGADIDAPDRSGTSPLVSAIARGRERIAGLLIDRGADVNGVSPWRSPLGAATWYWSGPKAARLRMTRRLVAKGADLKGIAGYRAVCQSVGHPELLRFLLRSGASAARPVAGKASPLHLCSQLDAVESAGILLAAGSPVDDSGMVGDTPLFEACCWKADRMAEFLIAHGADVNARHRDTAETPLHAAASDGSAVIVKLLLDHGADARARMPDGKTPLDCAVAYRDRMAAELREAAPTVSGKEARPQAVLESRSTERHLRDAVGIIEMLKAHNAGHAPTPEPPPTSQSVKE